MKITPTVRAIIGLELRSLVRDVRTVLMSIVLPVVLMPILLLISSVMEEQRVEREQTRTHRYAVTGSEAELVRSFLRALPDSAAGAADESAGPRFREITVEEPDSALASEEIAFYLEGLNPEEWRAELESDSARAEELEDFEDTPVVRVVYRSNRTAASAGARELQSRLSDIRADRRDSILMAAGFPVDPENVLAVDTANVASVDEVQGARMGRFLTLFLVMLMVTGGSVLAIDTLAGEKERGTLVTLLTTAASRNEIVTGKLMAVVIVALVIAVVQVVNLWVYLGLGLIPVGSSFAANITPGMAGLLLALYLPVVLLTAGLLLLMSAYARSYKEAQLVMTPLLIGLIVPSLAPMLPDIQLASAIVAVPLANISIAVRDVLVGQPNWLAIGAAWAVTAGVASWVTGLSVKALHKESVITGDTTRAEFLGGPALYRARVLRVFAVFWAVKILIEFNAGITDIRLSALVNVGLVFGLFPVYLIRRYRLDPVKALSLRMPEPGAWVGVVLGAPAGLLAATLVFQLASYVLPVPTQTIENFGQSLFPEDIPIWQVVILLSVIPGIVEELVFRGALLHGLRDRFGPVGLVLVVGLIFGFFHFQIFRIPSTAVLGMVLTAVVLLTGSIYTAMLWHILNNGLAIWLGSQGVEIADNWTAGAAGVVCLALAFWILWINRTPHPAMRSRRPSG